ncbi:MAG TPA: magnesium transporter [Dehalococcoidia bacterium]|nr:magnesium transporter [Dehalococcoidia bacterium]
MTTESDITTLADQLSELLDGHAVDAAVEMIASIHPADQADLYDNLDPEKREGLLALLSADGLAQLLQHLDEDQRQEIIQRMPRASLARVLDRMDNDEAADVLQQLPPAEAARVLANMTTAAQVTPLLEHEEESAGGIMTRGYVALHKDMTVQQAVTYLRLRKPFTEEASYLYVLDSTNHLEGVVNLRDLVVADPDTTIDEIMVRDIISVEPGTDREEAARILQRYRLRALPVVDSEGVLQGIITADDIIDVLSEEATEDMYRMAGVGVQEWVFSPLRESVMRRIPWLSFNMLWAFAGAAVITLFEGTLEKVAALAIFMPMIAGQAGNAGIQTATIVVRSMALGEVSVGDLLRVLSKEWALGAIKGTIFGTALGIIAWLWKDNPTLGFVAGLSLFCNMLVAATAGVLIPMTLRRLGFDPATIAGVFDTMLTDLMGFLIYLGLATIFITQLQG